MSRRTWYRKNRIRTGTDGTTLSAPNEDKPVPTGLAEGEFERGEAPRGKQGAIRLKSADGATLAADRFEALPLSEVTFWPRSISSDPDNRCEPEPGQTFAVVTIREKRRHGVKQMTVVSTLLPEG